MRRILLITSVLPWPLRRNGGAQRSALMKQALSKWGPVDVFAVGAPSLRDDENPQFDQMLQEHDVVECLVRQPPPVRAPFYLPGPLGNISLAIRRYEQHYEPDPQVVIRLEQLMRQREYGLVVARYLQPALQCNLPELRGIPRLLDFDDIDWSTFAASIAAKPWPGIMGRIGADRVLRRMRQICDIAVQRFERVFVTSDEDRALVPRETIVLPNIPFAEPERPIIPLPPACESRELLFVGDLQFGPNQDGLDRFLRHVWPAVRERCPDARIRVVGRGLSQACRSNWSGLDGVDVIGFSPDLVEDYRRCAFSIVPIYYGGGTKIKILESLAYGRAVITTPQAMRGYDVLAHREAVHVCASDEQFVEECLRLLQDPQGRNRMAEQGRAVVEQQFSFARFQRVVDSAVSEVIS